MDLGLSGKVAIVGGASRGIGRAAAEVLAEEGATLAICARTEGPLLELRDALAAKGTDVYAEACDLADGAAVNAFVANVLRRFGTIHVLVNNGPLPPWGPLFDEVTDESFRDAWDAKFLGYVRLSRAVLPAMRAQRWGRIVHVSGMAGRQPGKHYVVGSVIHAALPNLTKTMADTYGREGITINSIAPGPIATTDLTKRWETLAGEARQAQEEAQARFLAEVALDRFGSAREVGEVIAFLCSERASYITGTEVLVDGGRARGI